MSFRMSGWAGLVLVALAGLLLSAPARSQGAATDACGPAISARPADLPGLVEAVRTGGGCRRVTVSIPVGWAYEPDKGRGSLFRTASPFPAIGLTQLDLKGGEVDITAVNGYELDLARPFDRAVPKSDEAIKACRKARQRDSEYPSQKEVARLCASQALTLAVRFDNPDDIGLPGRIPLTPAQAARLQSGGLYLKLTLRIDQASITDDFLGQLVAQARLEGLRLTDPEGNILVAGVSSDSLSPPADTPRQWLKLPSAGDMARLYPSRTDLPGGKVLLQCRIGHLGQLRHCEVLEDEPQGVGYSDTALQLSRLFLAGPADPEGPSIAGMTIQIPITFAPAG
jgi:hypothetical protein